MPQSYSEESIRRIDTMIDDLLSYNGMRLVTVLSTSKSKSFEDPIVFRLFSLDPKELENPLSPENSSIMYGEWLK